MSVHRILGVYELECDEEETRWNERLKKVAKQKGEQEKSE